MRISVLIRTKLDACAAEILSVPPPMRSVTKWLNFFFFFRHASCRNHDRHSNAFFFSFSCEGIPHTALSQRHSSHFIFFQWRQSLNNGAAGEKYAHHYPGRKGYLSVKCRVFCGLAGKDHARGPSTNAITEKSCYDVVEHVWSDNRLA